MGKYRNERDKKQLKRTKYALNIKEVLFQRYCSIVRRHACKNGLYDRRLATRKSRILYFSRGYQNLC